MKRPLLQSLTILDRYIHIIPYSVIVFCHTEFIIHFNLLFVIYYYFILLFINCQLLNIHENSS